MTPEMILATIKAVAEAVTAVATWMMTDDGKAFVKQTTEDRAAWDKLWADAGNGLKTVFSGQLFKQ